MMLILLSGISATSAYASEEATRLGTMTPSALSEAPLLLSTDPGAERFLPVGKLKMGNTGGYNCTASLIAGAATPAPNTPALILTAGHCVDEGMSDNDVIVGQPAQSAWSYTPAYFIDTQPQHVPIGIDRVVYATMKGVDLAVLQLKATYGELAARGIHPLRLETTTAIPAAPIELTHIPVIGVEEDERFLRHSLCQMNNGTTPLVEGYAPWFWSATVSNDCQGVAGGTSGSPVFARGGTSVVGVLNTTVTPGYLGCGLGRPCEPTETGGYPREGSSYYIPVERIARALQDDGTLDLRRLDLGTGVALTRSPRLDWISRRYQLIDDQLLPARWNLHIEPGVDQVRFKTGLAQSIDCFSPKGYSAPLSAVGQPLLSLATSDREGIYAVCVIGRNAISGVWQLPQHATVRLRQIDETPPIVTPEIAERPIATSMQLLPLIKHYELEGIFIKYGATGTTDCSDPSGYREHRRSEWITVGKSPWRFCTYGTDFAGNAGPAASRDY